MNVKNGKKRCLIKITYQDVLDAMQKIEPEQWGIETKKRSVQYKGWYVWNQSETEHYGIKKLFKEIIKAKNCVEAENTAEEVKTLNRLGFKCGLDQVVHNYFYSKRKPL